MHDLVKNTGTVLIQFIDSAGEVVEELEQKNMVVDSGLAWIAARMSGSPDPMSYMAMGGYTGAPALTDINLFSETARVALTSAVTVGKTTTYTATFAAGTGSGSFAELGIFNAAVGGTMLSRVAFAVQTKEATTSVKVVWSITQS
jgi:hypothetical protein